jgi:cephalosporin-C deacetylase
MLPNRSVSFSHEFPFDPSYGHDLHELLKVGAPPAPGGFDRFWESRYEQTRAVAPNITTRATSFSNDLYDIREIEFDSIGGFRVGGWVSIPRNRAVTVGLIMGHGYGGREMPEVWTQPTSTAAIFPCARGFHRSAHPDWPGEGGRHVLTGIASKETYSHGLCAADLWAAGTALTELCPGIADNLVYYGTSFGGGIGAMAVPWDPRIQRAFLDVPSFGNHPLRVTLRCAGSGEFVRHHVRHHPEAMDVLAFFDSAIHAQRIQAPTLVAAALFDPAVPPPGQFAVHNALQCQKSLFIRTAGHFTYPEEPTEMATMRHQAMQWLGIG